MFQGGITLEITADRYIREILELHVVPFAPFSGGGYLFDEVNELAN